MRVVVQRVTEAEVTIDGVEKRSIAHGFLLLLGIEGVDQASDIDWLVRKLSTLRVFADEQGRMNRSIQEINGAFLVVSQFTLHASTKKGNRPSFIRAARPEQALPLYRQFLSRLAEASGCLVTSGEFGADMQIRLNNDGPVTLVIDSQNRE